MIVGVIGDLHAPFEHRRYIGFCQETFRRWGVEQVVSIGDVVDNHAISFHEHDPDGLSPGDELKLVQKKLSAWEEAFPGILVAKGNHDDRIERRIFNTGLPNSIVRPLPEILGVSSWIFEEEFVIDGVLYQHGVGSGGKDGALNSAIRNRQSFVMGHSHSFGGVKYTANSKDMIFGMNTGCGIDVKAYAFAYGKAFPLKPTLGCGIVVHGKEGYFIPMV